MADWDADSPKPVENLKSLLRTLKERAERRVAVSADDAKEWHHAIMHDLDVPDPSFVGRFRGEAGLEGVRVLIDGLEGVPPGDVETELQAYETRLIRAVSYLDELIPGGRPASADTLDAVVDLCGWVHAEWVRIHPFANGNGRTARLWANFVAMRYGLPPFVRLRPRPANDRYGAAGADALSGDWQPTADLFRTMLDDFLDEDH